MPEAKQFLHCIEASERPLEIQLIGQESLHQRPTHTMEFISHSLPFLMESPANPYENRKSLKTQCLYPHPLRCLCYRTLATAMGLAIPWKVSELFSGLWEN